MCIVSTAQDWRRNKSLLQILKEYLTDTTLTDSLIKNCDWYLYLGIHVARLLAVASTTCLHIARGIGNINVTDQVVIVASRFTREHMNLYDNTEIICTDYTDFTTNRCGACDKVRGTFIKDYSGKKDEDGRRYRRFVRRVTGGCKKLIGVTEFLQICRIVIEKRSLCGTPTIVASENQPEPSQPPSTRLHNKDLPTLKHRVETPQLCHSIPILDSGLPNTDPGISSTKWKDFITTDIQYKKEQEKATKELWDEIFILCNELHQARQDMLDLKYQLSEFCPRSNHSTISSAIFQQLFNEADTTMNGSRSTTTSLPFLPHPNDDIAAVKLSLPSLPIKHNAKSTYSSVLRQDKPGPGTTKEGEQLTRNPLRKQRVSTSTPLYLEGIPHIPIVEVKELLKAGPIRIQLRHMRNISWIDRCIVELLVDTNHFVHIRNRLENYSKYKVNRIFDPLTPSSFNCVTKRELHVTKYEYKSENGITKEMALINN
ncbi:hypothetical protein HOY82DRAFT_542194 [Tuber indicum]|nr:hypothetical protein HOY82DRAFT_542194 [Tuber indicum]